jgi:hypothetical protein
VKDRKCIGTTKTGEPCQSFAIGDSPFCVVHDPARAERRADWQRLGGQNRALAKRRDNALPPALQTAKAALLEALEAVRSGTMDPARGTAIATPARACARRLGVRP